MRALSAGSSLLDELLGAERDEAEAVLMLPLRSSMTTIDSGCVSVWNSVIGWSLPLS